MHWCPGLPQAIQAPHLGVPAASAAPYRGLPLFCGTVIHQRRDPPQRVYGGGLQKLAVGAGEEVFPHPTRAPWDSSTPMVVSLETVVLVGVFASSRSPTLSHK